MNNNDKTKIAYIVHGLGAEGISSFSVNLMSKLDMSKFDVSVIMAVDDNGVLQEKEEEILKYGVTVYRTCDLGSVSRIKTHLKKLKSILLKTGPYDVMHSNMDLLNGLNLMVAKKVGISKRISHAHCSAGVPISNPVKRIIACIYRVVMKFLLNHFATVRLGCSDLANEYFYGNKKSSVIYNGIETGRFTQCDVDITEYKKSLGVEPNKKLILNVARISPPKNPLFMAEIIRDLKSLRNDFQFIWVGDGELAECLKEKVKECNIEDCFRLIGIRSDIPQILKCADMFLLPSLFEGMPISVIEAQCADCRCLLSDNITKMVDMGLCCYLPVTNSNVWAEKIDGLLREGKNITLSADKILEFDLKTMAEKIADIYIYIYNCVDN